jgi:hypothetical protein
MLAWLLAHQGGWDEILMVVGPLALLWFLLRKAKARAGSMEGPEASTEEPRSEVEAASEASEPET